MKIAIFLLVLATIIFNWAYKKDDNIKFASKFAFPSAIAVLSILGIVLGQTKVIYYIYLGYMLASSLAKIIVNKYVLGKIIKKPLDGIEQKLNLILSYIDCLFTIVATCFVWRKVTYIILAIAILLILILVHEFGHYTAGKLLGFKINEFSVGFGPAIWQKTKADGQKVSLRVFPLGGYCAFEGEDEEGETEDAFNKQKPWKRLIVLFAGVFFNFLFGIITSVVYLCFASYSLPKVIQLSDGNTNPIMVGDVITAVNGKEFSVYRVSKDTFAQFSSMTSKFGEGEEFTITVIRNNEKIDLTVKKENRPANRYITNLTNLEGKLYIKTGEDSYSLIANEDLYAYIKDLNNPLDNLYKFQEVAGEQNYILMEKNEVFALGGITESKAGVSLGILQTYERVRFNVGEAFLYAIPFGLDVCWLILKVLGGIFTGATAIGDLGGTITSVDMIAEITQSSVVNVIYLLPMISMNLAVFNILPIPALDGARMVFVLIEMIRKKPINKNVEGYIHFFGLIILLALVVFLDIYHFI